MNKLDQKISLFIEKHFPDIDYSVLGGNEDKPEARMALNYEYFVNALEVYNLTKNIDSEEVKQISTGDLQGIDGFYIVVNNRLFTIPESDASDEFKDWEKEFDNFINGSKIHKIEASITFIQSKSKKTDLGPFNIFCNSIYDIFSENTNSYKSNPKIITLLDAYSKICKRENEIHLVVKYCSIKKDLRTIKNDRKVWESEINNQKEDLKSTKFESVEIELISGQEYEKKLDTFNSPNKRKYAVQGFNLSRWVQIIQDELKCYLGYLTIKEIIDILTKDDGTKDDVFFDNIRYFEGKTPVNSKIERSLKNNSKIFHALHNGVIITAREEKYIKDDSSMEISAFSVVNGCQTCNVIWNWAKQNNKSNEELEKIKVPAKIVIAENSEIRSLITEAANSQNEIKSIQLISISDNAKTLQQKFNDLILVNRNEKLYYERLSNQYPEIGESFKMTTEDIFRAFYSSFGKVPHHISRTFGKYMDSMIEKKDFLSDDEKGNPKKDVQTFFTSSLAFSYLSRHLRSKYKSLFSLRHHILLLFFITQTENFEQIDSQKIEKEFVEKIRLLIDNKSDFEDLCSKIVQIMVNNMPFLINNDNNDKYKIVPKSYYTEENTIEMIKIFKQHFYQI